MNLIIKENGDILTVSPDGELNNNNSKIFEKAIFQLLSEGHNKMILNLSNSRYIVSQGLGTIASATLKARHNHGDIKLIGINTRVKSLFETASLTQVIEIFESEEKAIEAFGAKG